ncbi:MAG: EF-P beta-lysylation protein EpmB [Gammaproteobacteria bacterium]|nr:EF-P beta-lysylation protein EpmB [Gammaproteobacteria bacterium]
MITRSARVKHTPAWQTELCEAISDPAELLRRLRLDRALLPAARRAARLFPLRAPLSFVARMKPGDPNDPLLRQILPLDIECEDARGFVADPVGDLGAMPVPGLLHKYRGRALLIATGACAVHCRYCFRRHFPYSDARPSADSWRALDYIAADRSIREVILSGGDPLSLNDRRLSELVARIEAINHVQRLRIHTRQPVVLPARVDDMLLGWLGETRLKKIVVVHVNHANELDTTVVGALGRLKTADVTLLNQSVLLRGVNDSLETLRGLGEALFEAGVLPYYLHLLDRVQGAAHFHVSAERALELIGDLNDTLPGYLVPRLVTERAGDNSKRWIS